MLACCTLAYLLSVTYGVVRLLYLATLAWGLIGAAVGLVRLAVRVPRRRPVIPLAGMLMLGWAVLGGRPVEKAALRAADQARLRAFEHTRYVWGGETHAGIDCSGLARIALCEALVAEGVRTANPRLLGPRLWRVWWQDVRAEALRDGRFGLTIPVGNAPRLAGYDSPDLRPGDLAVTAPGRHVLVYLGRRRWIEANPDDRRVVINRAGPDSPRGYFHIPAAILRWKMLE